MEMVKVKNLKKYLITLVLVSIFSAIFWWQFADDLFARDSDLEVQLRKFNFLLYKIRQEYVEEPDLEKLLDGAINGMLESLDPHSVYIPAEEQTRLTEQFRGDFEGIGISFVLQNKILTVISPIPGTPADLLGIRAGDKILEIDNQSAYGITNEEVFKKLRGPKGTMVKVKIAREGVPETLEFNIIRDKIPIHSVETALMLDDSTGYILLNQFTSNTSTELDSVIRDLASRGMRRLLFDLRGNSGGYLEQAVKVADKFIRGKERLVFTRGRSPDSEVSYYSSDEGVQTDVDLVILINHGSASASEIVAGAVQDLDRGLVAGSRSFGKGLVQSPIPFPDGSLVRLTTARYYTPSGRLIQRSYSDENVDDYYQEGYKDTVEAVRDTTKEVYFTKSRRKVFGSGGIEPDLKLPSSYFTAYSMKLLNQRLFFEYGSNYAGKHPELRKDFEYFLHHFEVTEEMLSDFNRLAETKEVKMMPEQYNQDLPYIKNLIKAEIAQNLFNGRWYYYRVRIEGDDQVQEARKHFSDAKKIALLNKKSR